MLALNFIQKSNIDADKIDILKLLIKRSNRHLKGNVQIQLQKDYFNIDLSTTKDFRYLIALNGLAINKLNLKIVVSFTQVNSNTYEQKKLI